MRIILLKDGPIPLYNEISSARPINQSLTTNRSCLNSNCSCSGRAGRRRRKRSSRASAGRRSASRAGAAPGSWWARWLVGPVLEVHEQEDEPLLFTVRRCWSFAARYLVCDADDVPVGELDRSQLLDRLGRLFSVRRREGERLVFRTSTGCPVAEAEAVEETVRLSFHAAVEHQPFAKMLLLAAVLKP